MNKELKKDIKSFLREQKTLIPRLKTMDKTQGQLEKRMERYVAKAWKATKKKVQLHVGTLQGGSHCMNFKMDVSIGLPDYARSGRKWMQILYDELANETYAPVDPPVEMKFLKSFAETMTAELGIRVWVYQAYMPTEEEQQARKEAQEAFDEHEEDNG